jgi:hypothetical protein
VSDLAGTVGRAVKELPLHDDSATDSGADGDADGVAGAAGRAPPPFTQHGAVGIVVQHGGQSQPFMDNLTQREIDPAEIGREKHDPTLGVERSWRPDSDPQDFDAGHFAPGLLDGALGQGNQPVEHVPLAGLGMGGLTSQCVQR